MTNEKITPHRDYSQRKKNNASGDHSGKERVEKVDRSPFGMDRPNPKDHGKEDVGKARERAAVGTGGGEVEAGTAHREIEHHLNDSVREGRHLLRPTLQTTQQANPGVGMPASAGCKGQAPCLHPGGKPDNAHQLTLKSLIAKNIQIQMD